MLIGIGIPIQNQVYTNEEIAFFLVPYRFYEDEPVIESPYNFLNFRETSASIEDFVFEIKKFQKVTEDEDIVIGLSIWESIEESMINFLNNMYTLSNEVKQVINDDPDIQQNDDPLAMGDFYLNIFEKIVRTVSNNIDSYKNAIKFLEKYNSKHNKQVSK